LFTALAFAWDKQDAQMVIVVIAALGIAVASSVGLGTYRANKAMSNIET
jgi:hypothetical protein